MTVLCAVVNGEEGRGAMLGVCALSVGSCSADDHQMCTTVAEDVKCVYNISPPGKTFFML